MILIKKKPVSTITADTYEKPHPETITRETTQQRMDKAYPNEPGQFPLILSDLWQFDLHKGYIGTSTISDTVPFCKHIFEVLEKCEFFNFTPQEYKVFVETLNEMGCKPYEEILSYYKSTGNRNIVETIALKNNIEFPLEIFDKLNKSENFDFMRILIQNGALRKWINAQEEKKVCKTGDGSETKETETSNETSHQPGE